MSREREIPNNYRNKIAIQQSIPFIILLVMAWGLFLARWLADFDVLTLLSRRKEAGTNEPLSLAFYATFAFVGTPLCILFAFLQIRRSLQLAANGVKVTATLTLTTVGMKKLGLVSVRYTYQVDGKDYDFAEDVLRKDAELGRELILLIDPAKPNRAVPYASVFSSGEPST